MSLKDDILRGAFPHCPAGYAPVQVAADAVCTSHGNPFARYSEGEARLREVEPGDFYLDEWGEGEDAACEEYVHARTIRAAALSAGNLGLAADMDEVLALLARLYPDGVPATPPGHLIDPDFNPFTAPLPAGASPVPIPLPVPSASPTPLPDTPVSVRARPVSVRAQQGEMVLEVLRSLGVNPMAVLTPRGKKGDKALARDARPEQMTKSQFDSAWEYLRAEGKIQNYEPPPRPPSHKIGEGGRLSGGGSAPHTPFHRNQRLTVATDGKPFPDSRASSEHHDRDDE